MIITTNKVMSEDNGLNRIGKKRARRDALLFLMLKTILKKMLREQFRK